MTLASLASSTFHHQVVISFPNLCFHSRDPCSPLCICSNKLNLFSRLRRGRRLFQAFFRLHRETFLLRSLFVHLLYHLYNFLTMAPKKRSQTPRHYADHDSQPLSDQSHTSPPPRPPSYPDPTIIKDHRRKVNLVDPHPSHPHHTSQSPLLPESPRSPIDGAPLGSHSRRESTSTMRTSSISLDGAAAGCTPTGRVSKAKKGKRVHACDFPGCGKVSLGRAPSSPHPPPPGINLLGPFKRPANPLSRSLHELNIEGKARQFDPIHHPDTNLFHRRHELNHNPDALFPCTRPGCRKAFHRVDLLQRHQERQYVPAIHP